MWSCKTIFASCFELNFHGKPDITISRIDPECKKCVTLHARLKLLHEASQVGSVFVEAETVVAKVDEAEGEGAEDEEDEPPKCHQIWLNSNPTEIFNGPEDFPLTAKRNKFVRPTPLPHQTGFKHRYFPRDWETKHPAVQMMWMLGNGKTIGILDGLFTNSGGPPRSTFIVCPKTLLGMWAQAVRKYADLPKMTKCRVVVCGFSYFTRIVAAPSETPYTVREITRSCVIVDENQAFRNVTENMEPDIKVLQDCANLFLLSGTPVTKASDVEALSMCLSVEAPKDTSPSELSRWVGELRANNQIDFYNPELMQPSYHRDHFPDVERETLTVPMSYSQLWATLMCQRKLLHSPTNTVLGNAKTDSYAVLSRGYANSVTLRDGTVISPKGDLIIKCIQEGTETETATRHAVTSEYLENGVFPVAASLRACKEIKGVELIDGGQSAESRTKAIDKYNSGKSSVLCYSTCGRDGLDLRATDTLHLLEAQRNKILAGQSIGRVIRFGSHPKGGKVRVVNYVSSLPRDPPDPSSTDWQGLLEVFKEHYSPEEFKQSEGQERQEKASRAERAASRTLGKSKARALAKEAADKHAEFWSREKEHVETVLHDIRKSLKHFGITESVEEQILRTRVEAEEAVQPFVDALIVAGVQENSALFNRYVKKLRLNPRIISEQRPSETQVLTADMKTFMRVADSLKVKPLLVEFVLKLQ